MKYVIFGDFYPVIFPDCIQHSFITCGCIKATSAGYFCITENNRIELYGESVSLGLKPNYEIDKTLLRQLIKGFYDR